MTENQGYYVSEGWYQTLTDFTSAVAKGTLTKARMGELATVHLDQLKAYEADGALPKATVVEFRGSDLEHEYVDEVAKLEALLKDHVSEIDRLRGLERELRAQSNEMVLGLQRVSGVSAHPRACLDRLWEVRECVDALFQLPTKAGVRDALSRVIALRECLVRCQEYIDEAVSAFDDEQSTVVDLEQRTRLSTLVINGHALSAGIGTLTRPKLSDVS